MKHVTPRDLLQYRFLSSPRFSPDGTKIAFAVHQADIDSNRYVSNLWLYDLNADSQTQLTSSGHEKAFCWSRDGTKILFVSERHKKENGGKSNKSNQSNQKQSALYSIGLGGGEALPLALIPEPVAGLWALPGGLLLKTVREFDEPKFEDADYMVFSQIPFSSNGKGLITGRRRAALSLCVPGAAEKPSELRRLSPDNMDVGQVRLSADGKSALAVGTVYTDVMPKISGVWKFDLESGAAETVLPQDEFIWYCADFFQGGVLATGSDMKVKGYNENGRFHFRTETETRCLTPGLDKGLRNSVICDCRYGVADANHAFHADQVSGKAWFVSTDDFHSHLHTVDAKGNVERVSTLSSVEDYDVSQGRAAVVGLEGLFLQELYLLENGGERRLTDFNRTASAEYEISVPEYARLENGTPWGLDCWYMRPIDFKVGKKYPTLLYIHGGPKMTYSDVFVHEMQCCAAEGFAVLFCNPRGSDGKDGDFADIRGKYGTIDYDDLMLFADWAVKTLPFVDENRMGVGGGSYGGFMTNWIVGHTNRFRAAVSQRGICNWVSMTGLSDIGYTFVPDQMAAGIWDDVDGLWRQSPLKYADQIRTPTLILHSDEDYRCEAAQAYQMFSALKRHGVESRLCVFKGENHDLSRVGSPKPRLARIHEIIEWFRDHL